MSTLNSEVWEYQEEVPCGLNAPGATVFANSAPMGERLVAECFGPKAVERAEFICRAYNSHKKLVELCDRLVTSLNSRLSGNGSESDNDELLLLLYESRNAIAKATGEAE